MCDCLEALDSHHGALPAHARMSRTTDDTVANFMGRLAVGPMVLEARSLNVTPGIIEVFRKARRTHAVEALEMIYSEEDSHIAYRPK